MQKFIKKNPKVRTVVEISEYKGKRYLNIRDWYQKSDGDYAPTQKGIAMPLEMAEDLSRLIKEVLNSKHARVKSKNKKHKKHAKQEDEEE